MKVKSDKYLWNICLDIYREMYREASPSTDFDKLMKIGETTKPDWFMKYYLNIDSQEKIIGYHLRKHKCDEWERQKIKTTIFLGCSPTSSKSE